MQETCEIHVVCTTPLICILCCVPNTYVPLQHWRRNQCIKVIRLFGDFSSVTCLFHFQSSDLSEDLCETSPFTVKSRTEEAWGFPFYPLSVTPDDVG